jgi:hypothetical protein
MMYTVPSNFGGFAAPTPVPVPLPRSACAPTSFNYTWNLRRMVSILVSILSWLILISAFIVYASTGT